MQNKIHFVEKNVSVDAQAGDELVRRNIRGVPAFFIGDDVVLGFDRARIMELVDHRLTECEQCQTRMRVPTGKSLLKVTCPKCKHSFDYQPL